MKYDPETLMPEKPKTGRKLAPVDPNLVEKLAAVGCMPGEISTIVGCSLSTLERRFADEMRKGRENVKARLRKKQIEVALAGNVSMLIWLGKQMLGQAEKVEANTHHSGAIVTGTLDPGTEQAVKDWAKTIQKRIKGQRNKQAK